MNLLHLSTAGALLIAPLAFAQSTVFHFRVNDVDAPGLPSIPSVGGSPGVAQVPFDGVLSGDVPTRGVPAGAGNRSLVGANAPTSGGVNSTAIDQIDNAKIIANGGFTFETWFKWYGGGNVNSIIDYAGTEKLRFLGGNLGMNFDAGSGFTPLVASPTTNEWHYVAVVFEYDGLPEVGGRIGGTLTYYYNDNYPLGSVPVVKDDFGDSLNRVIGVGRHPLGFGGDNFDGLVYEPRVSLGARENNNLLFFIPPNSNPELLAADTVSANGDGNPLQLVVPVRNAIGTSFDLEISSVNLTGPDAASFTISSFDPLVQANGGSGSITVDFDPSSGDGLYQSTLIVNSNNPLEPAYEIDLSIDVRDPAIVIGTTLDFGLFLSPTTLTETIEVENLGGVTTLILSNPRFSGAGADVYSIDGTLPEIAPGGIEEVIVLFAPVTGGAFPAILTLDTNDPRNPQVTVSLSGIVQDPEISIEPSLGFGSLTANPGVQSVKTFADNFGQTQDLVMKNPKLTGPAAAFFSITTEFPLTIPALEFEEIGFEFDPGTEAGSFLAEVTFETNDPVNPTVTIILSALVEGEIDLEGPSKVSHWTFDDPGNIGHDSGGFGYDGMVVGAATFSKLSTVGGGALALTGNGAHLEIPLGNIRYEHLNDDGDGFTVATWVNSNSGITSFPRQRYFSKLGVDPFGFGVGQDGDTRLLGTTYGIADYLAAAGTAPVQDEWHHVAYVFSGSPVSSIRFYVDGNLVSTVAGSSGLNTSVAPSFAIGGLGGGAGEWFDGMLDDLRVYAVELNEAEISELVSMGTIGPVTGAGNIAITSVEMIDPGHLRIEFKGAPNTVHQIKSSPDLSAPFEGVVIPSLNGLTTDGEGKGFVEVPATVPGSGFFQIQEGL